MLSVAATPKQTSDAHWGFGSCGWKAPVRGGFSGVETRFKSAPQLVRHQAYLVLFTPGTIKSSSTFTHLRHFLDSIFSLVAEFTLMLWVVDALNTIWGSS